MSCGAFQIGIAL